MLIPNPTRALLSGKGVLSGRGILFSALDADVVTFASASGATDLAAHNALTLYLKSQSLYTHSRWGSFKSAQANGSGSTVNCLGGWTSNNIILVGSPPWASADMNFNGSGRYAYIDLPGFQSLSAGFIMTRFKPKDASTPDAGFFHRWWFGDNAVIRFLGSSTSTGAISLENYATFQEDGGGGDRTGSNTFSWTANEDFTEVCKFGTFPTTAGIWKNDTPITMNLSSGSQVFTPAATGYTTNERVYISSSFSTTASASLAGSWIVQFLCKVTLTTEQREAIRGLLAAF